MTILSLLSGGFHPALLRNALRGLPSWLVTNSPQDRAAYVVATPLATLCALLVFWHTDRVIRRLRYVSTLNADNYL
jgi:hypothetical protein